jgi:hypothetical protein
LDDSPHPRLPTDSADEAEPTLLWNSAKGEKIKFPALFGLVSYSSDARKNLKVFFVPSNVAGKSLADNESTSQLTFMRHYMGLPI